MELSIDEKRVVLSDFDSWGIILNNGLISQFVLSDFDSWGIILNNGLISQSEEEDEQLENKYEQLSDSEKKRYKYENRRCPSCEILPYGNL